MFGSWRARKRARKLLHAEKVSPTAWRVWGGEAEHKVTVTGGEFICDCTSGQAGANCSHKIRVGMEIAPDLFILHCPSKTAPKYNTVKYRLKKAGIERNKANFSRAMQTLTKGKEYTPEVMETVSELAFKYLNGGK